MANDQLRTTDIDKYTFYKTFGQPKVVVRVDNEAELLVSQLFIFFYLILFENLLEFYLIKI